MWVCRGGGNPHPNERRKFGEPLSLGGGGLQGACSGRAGAEALREGDRSAVPGRAAPPGHRSLRPGLAIALVPSRQRLSVVLSQIKTQRFVIRALPWNTCHSRR